jgi:thiol-disulfide isomerase/thioredoxin
MKKYLFVILALGSISMGTWLNSFEKASSKANEEHKNLLLYFSGSDWCVPCKKMESGLLSSPEFLAYADKNLVLFKADFPREKELTFDKNTTNQKLLHKYNPDENFPMNILFVDGKPVKEWVGTLNMTPAEFVKTLNDYDDPIIKLHRWQTDFDLAVNKSKLSKKDVLVYFGASDWCVPCKRMERGLLSEPEVLHYLGENFELVKLDFPRINQQSKTAKIKNNSMLKKYNPDENFPMLILFKDGKMVESWIGTVEKSATEFMTMLSEARNKK